jgi:hypothetical protein
MPRLLCFPALPMQREACWWLASCHESGERVIDTTDWRRWTATALDATAADPQVSSFADLSLDEWMAAWARKFHADHGRLPAPGSRQRAASALRGLLPLLAVRYGSKLWWQHDVWCLRFDPRIPRREHEPRGESSVHWTDGQKKKGGPLDDRSVACTQRVIGNFYRAMHDYKADVAAIVGDDRWLNLTDAHARLYRPGEFFTERVIKEADERNYISDADLSKMLACTELLGMPRSQSMTITCDGRANEAAGFGQPATMRAWLIQALTGRRASEILLTDFDPLSPVPGIAPAEVPEGGMVARLRYQQTKVDDAPKTILVGADVVEIVREQREWVRQRRNPGRRAPPSTSASCQRILPAPGPVLRPGSNSAMPKSAACAWGSARWKPSATIPPSSAAPASAAGPATRTPAP